MVRIGDFEGLTGLFAANIHTLLELRVKVGWVKSATRIDPRVGQKGAL
jgi:hypothetical protein